MNFITNFPKTLSLRRFDYPPRPRCHRSQRASCRKKPRNNLGPRLRSLSSTSKRLKFNAVILMVSCARVLNAAMKASSLWILKARSTSYRRLNSRDWEVAVPLANGVNPFDSASTFQLARSRTTASEVRQLESSCAMKAWCTAKVSSAVASRCGSQKLSSTTPAKLSITSLIRASTKSCTTTVTASGCTSACNKLDGPTVFLLALSPPRKKPVESRAKSRRRRVANAVVRRPSYRPKWCPTAIVSSFSAKR